MDGWEMDGWMGDGGITELSDLQSSCGANIEFKFRSYTLRLEAFDSRANHDLHFVSVYCQSDISAQQ